MRRGFDNQPVGAVCPNRGHGMPYPYNGGHFSSNSITAIKKSFPLSMSGNDFHLHLWKHHYSNDRFTTLTMSRISTTPSPVMSYVDRFSSPSFRL